MAKAKNTANQLALFQEGILHPFTELDSTRESALKCTKCYLSKERKNVVFGFGNTASPPSCFVGEGPGEQEDLTGKPFVGRAGKLLTKMIEAIGFTRDEVYICNVVCCRPPNNRIPTLQEIAACSGYLVRQIRIVRPLVIVALGATAAEVLLGTKKKISSLRGEWFDWDGHPLRVTFHPAYLLRNAQQKLEAFADLKAVAVRAEMLRSANG